MMIRELLHHFVTKGEGRRFHFIKGLDIIHLYNDNYIRYKSEYIRNDTDSLDFIKSIGENIIL